MGGHVDRKKKMNVQRAHMLLGHGNEERTRATAQYLGWNLSRGFKPCQNCAEAKAKQKNVPKESHGAKATEPNGRLYHDLAKVEAPEDSGIVVRRKY